MIGVDTNVLVRLFVDEDEDQHRSARRFFAERSSDSPAFVSLVVMAEFVWVLARIYRMPKATILELVENLTQTIDLVVERGDLVATAVSLAKERKGDFADLLIAHIAQGAGVDHTVTFDRDAARKIPSMRLIA